MLHVHTRLFLVRPRTISHTPFPLQSRCRPPSTQPTRVRKSKLQLPNCSGRTVSHPRSCSYHSNTATSDTNKSLTSRARRSCQSDREPHSDGAVAGTARWLNGRIRYRSSCSNSTSTSSCESAAANPGADASHGADTAAVLLRMAKYIEEDRSAADKLAEVVGEETRSKLSAAMDGMEYAVHQPTMRELRTVAFTSAIPFLGFGFMDNAIMIVAGEYIDLTVGVAFGISTMAAAALGNTISDLSGLGLGGAIEGMATRLGLPPANLSRAQMLLRRTRMASLLGSAIGVTLGCLIGMFPLLLMPAAETVEAVKRKEKVVGLIDAVVKEAASFLSATSATLFILDRETGTLWARERGLPGTPNADHVQDLKIDLNDRGPVSGAARAGEPVCLRAGREGAASASMLCMPVFGADGAVAGVVQVVGKEGDGGTSSGGFTAEDAKDLSALCSHISVALENIKRADEADEVDLTETISLMRSYGGVSKKHPFPQHRSTSVGRSPTSTPSTPPPTPLNTIPQRETAPSKR